MVVKHLWLGEVIITSSSISAGESSDNTMIRLQAVNSELTYIEHMAEHLVKPHQESFASAQDDTHFSSATVEISATMGDWSTPYLIVAQTLSRWTVLAASPRK